MKVVRLVFGIFFVVGLGLLIGGVVSIQHTRRFLQTAVEVPGVVTENVWREERTSDNRASWAFYPRIRYRIVCQWLDPAKNEMHIFNSANIWFDPTNYIPGKTIEVLVDPNNPRRYAVET